MPCNIKTGSLTTPEANNRHGLCLLQVGQKRFRPRSYRPSPLHQSPECCLAIKRGYFENSPFLIQARILARSHGCVDQLRVWGSWSGGQYPVDQFLNVSRQAQEISDTTAEGHHELRIAHTILFPFVTPSMSSGSAKVNPRGSSLLGMVAACLCQNPKQAPESWMKLTMPCVHYGSKGFVPLPSVE
jgi:hypothetical protein